MIVKIMGMAYLYVFFMLYCFCFGLLFYFCFCILSKTFNDSKNWQYYFTKMLVKDGLIFSIKSFRNIVLGMNGNPIKIS